MHVYTNNKTLYFVFAVLLLVYMGRILNDILELSPSEASWTRGSERHVTGKT